MQKAYYKVRGRGEPLVMLHGNSASSRMFQPILKRLSLNFKLILVDLPGHGKSGRLEEFPTDFWYENALAVIDLLRAIGTPPYNLLGSSGGAMVALNIALEAPEMAGRIIADSFEGERSDPDWVEGLRAEREADKQKMMMKIFWWFNHGLNWRGVVDNDTDMMIRFHKEIGNFFHKDLSEVKSPVLLTGSMRDQFIKDIAGTYAELAEKMPKAETLLFEEGGHPACLSNPKEFVDAVIKFLK